MKPDSFLSSPYRWITNQAGHAALVGMPIGTALAWVMPVWAVPVATLFLYALLWEFGWQRRKYPGLFDWKDSLTDAVCVACGAAIIAGFSRDLLTGTLSLSGFMAVIMIGALRRWQH